MHSYLGVGVADELYSGDLQLMAKGGEILDDAVVDDGDLAGGVAVRMRVAVGGATMGGPPDMAEADVAGQRRRNHLRQHRLQIGKSTSTTTNGQIARFGTAVDQRDSRRVVAAVLHPAQRIHDDPAGRALPDVADKSTHNPVRVVQPVQ
uniref:B229_F2_64 n=1 Tax=Mycobacterium leprae TaxID=1769 RepID=Q49876_MYCLR|nr:B229_F2_64 [Mycobacterium leprae]